MLSPTILAAAMVFVHADDTKMVTVTDSARKTLESFHEGDAKLRTNFKKVVLEHKRLVGLAAASAAAKAASVNARSIDARERNAAEAHRLDGQLEAAKPNYDKMVEEHNEKLDELLKQVNAVPGQIRVLGDQRDKDTLSDLIRFTDLFVFDTKHEVPNIQASSSFVDQLAWREAAKAMGKHGAVAIPKLRKCLSSPNAGTRYAAAMALGEIGPEVSNVDKFIVSEIGAIRSRLMEGTIDRTEKNRRAKILDEAMEKIRASAK